MRGGLPEGKERREVGSDQSAQYLERCGEVDQTTPEGDISIQEEQIEILLKCPHCGKDIRSKSGLTLHIRRCKPEEIVLHDLNDGLYCLVGHEPQEHHKREVYELKLELFFDPDSNLFEALKEYFVTSGEAIAKAEKLEKDAWRLAGDARRVLRLLRETRADAKYLETGFDHERRLLLKKKNPRNKTVLKIKHEDD